ncbi:cytochrome P450 [Aspergillus tubingensis]|uniref:cytochrome P450 n=1 Tax=Aspergillus tubingensis TaxID=5068 RepID=UPI0015794F47|nr:cytochrome P450 [Aspergillus tubingensis]GFN11401.1 cytochrome P450 [Aspergillus tubingensis]
MIANLAIVVVFGIDLMTLLYMITQHQPSRRAEPDETRPPLKLPLIGDLHSSPIDKPLANWDDWARRNGPITVSRLFGIAPVVILNSYEAVTELSSRRSQWYSNRPRSATMEIITGAEPGQSRFTLMHDYDDHLRLHSQTASSSLGALAAPRYQPLTELENKQLLCDLNDLSPPGTHPVKYYSRVTLRPANPPPPEDELLQEIIGIQAQVTHLAANPSLPDLIPTLRQLPESTSLKRAADELFATQLDLYTQEALATAEKYTAVPGLDLAFALATSIQGGMETSSRQRRGSTTGKRIATDGAFLQVANLLWAFDIMPVEGEEMDPWAMTVVGFMTMPKELRMRLKPRGDWVMEAIKRGPKIAAEDLDQVVGSVNDVEGQGQGIADRGLILRIPDRPSDWREQPLVVRDKTLHSLAAVKDGR